MQEKGIKRTIEELRIWQSMPLYKKIDKSLQTIEDWGNEYGEENIYYSFSGGKDSTVLRDLVLQVYPNCRGMFVNTGLEYPEIQAFVKQFDNIDILRPKIRFDEVIKKYGYPFISKSVANRVRLARQNIANKEYSIRLMQLGVKEEEYGGLVRIGDFNYEKTVKGSKYASPKYKPLLEFDSMLSEECCDVMKKDPAHSYQEKTGRKPILGTMACESQQRESSWINSGCNAFSSRNPRSAPLSFWLNQDILQYIKGKNLLIAKPYGSIVVKGKDGNYYNDTLCTGCGVLKTTGCDRTGCIFCGFGAHREKGEGRFVRLKHTHPRQYEYCMGGGAYDSDGFWKPNKDGLGMAHVIDGLCRIYGKDFIKY